MVHPEAKSHFSSLGWNLKSATGLPCLIALELSKQLLVTKFVWFYPKKVKIYIFNWTHFKFLVLITYKYKSLWEIGILNNWFDFMPFYTILAVLLIPITFFERFVLFFPGLSFVDGFKNSSHLCQNDNILVIIFLAFYTPLLAIVAPGNIYYIWVQLFGERFYWYYKFC